jgi:transposase
MRGDDYNQSKMFCYVSCEDLVPEGHPLRKLREQAEQCLKEISRKFTPLYSQMGRPSIAPEKLLRALLLQVLYSIRSERMLMEQLSYNFLFRWFVGLSMEEKVWDPTVFSKNRDRLLEGEIAAAFFGAVLRQAREQDLLSDEHFSVDGTLIEAWASEKSFQRRPDPPQKGTGARGRKLLHDVCGSVSDPEARKFKKSRYGDAKLCHMGHVLMDNRHGLVANSCVTEASTGAERPTALKMLQQMRRSLSQHSRLTVGADKGYDERKFVTGARQLQVTPHVSQFQKRTSSIDGRTTRHPGYEQSIKRRPRIEQIFSWLKNVAMFRKTRHRGHRKIEWLMLLALSAYNLVRMTKLTLHTT